MKDRAVRLRNMGYTYAEIAYCLGITQPKAWQLLNPDRYRSMVKDSVTRYNRRGCVPLADMTWDQGKMRWVE